MYYIMNIFVVLLLVACQSVHSNTKTELIEENEVASAPNPFIQEVIEYKGVDYVIGIVDLRTNNLKTFHKNNQGELFKNFEAVKTTIEAEGKELLFAMNGGIFNKDRSPTGLYIENSNVITPLNTSKGKGNFFLEPNGVLNITKNKEVRITNTTKYKQSENTETAIQSGPQLLTDGKIHPKFNESSPNTHIRNGVGVVDKNTLVFAMSTEKVNLHTFASFFQGDLFKCKDALYLDGFVSKVYSPELNFTEMESDFSVIIGVVE